MAVSRRGSVLLFIYFLGLAFLVLTPSTSWASDEHPKVVYLHTEFFPYPKLIAKNINTGKPEWLMDTRITRELVRQAFLMSLREEFGVIAKDGTLYQSVPAEDDTLHLALLTRRHHKGMWYIKLFALDSASDSENLSDLWEDGEPIYRFSFNVRHRFESLLHSTSLLFEQMSRWHFVEAGKVAGLQPWDKKEVVDSFDDDSIDQEAIEKLLNEVDFVANFSAIRLVHQSVRESGPSAAKLGLLVRGYANLAMLTAHHKNSSRDVFLARMILYARRLNVIMEQDVDATLHYAHALSTATLFNQANLFIRGVDRYVEKNKIELPKNPPGSRTWSDLLRIYASWNRDKLLAFAENRDEPLANWARRLWFQQIDYYRYNGEIIEAFRQSVDQIPTAYGIYNSCHRTNSVEGMRLGTPAATVALQKFLPVRLSNVDGIPDSVTELKSDGNRYSTYPRNCSRALRKASKDDLHADLSWDVLAFLIEEEQFCQVVNHLYNQRNATSSDFVTTVNAFMPLVRDHRDASFVKSWKYRGRNDRDKRRAVLKEMSMHDASNRTRRMSLLYSNFVFGHETSEARELFWGSANTIQQTFHDILSAANPHAESYSHNDEMRAYIASYVASVKYLTPLECEVGTRLQIKFQPDANEEQLDKWQERLDTDPLGWALLGQRYEKLGLVDQATECFETAIKNSNEYSIVAKFSQFAYRTKRFDLWEEILLEFLQYQQHGMDNSSACMLLVDGFASFGRWEDALQYAEKSGEVYSFDGLTNAYRVNEALCRWDQAEEYVQSLAHSYYSGKYQWYFFCMRTGCGNVEAAAEYAKGYFDGGYQNVSPDRLATHAAYYLFNEDIQTATDVFKQMVDRQNGVFKIENCLLASEFSRQTGNEQDAEGYLKEAESRLELLLKHHLRSRAKSSDAESNDSEQSDAEPNQDKSTSDDPAKAGVAASEEISDEDWLLANGFSQVVVRKYLAEFYRAEAIADSDLEKLSGILDKFEIREDHLLSYLLGLQLVRCEQDEQAEEFFHRCIRIDGIHPGIYSTLGGFELCKRYGQSREDDETYEGKTFYRD